MNLLLRKATQRDADVILRINLRSIFELCASAYDASTLHQWVGNRTADKFTEHIAQGRIYLADLDGEPVGFFDFEKGEVLAVYILPGFERRGIGSFLLSEAVRKASEGQRAVTVYASLNAVSFYERHGFRSVNQITDSRNGIDLQLVQMELSVGAAPGTALGPEPMAL